MDISKQFQTYNLSSIILCLLSLSTVFILFISRSPNTYVSTLVSPESANQLDEISHFVENKTVIAARDDRLNETSHFEENKTVIAIPEDTREISITSTTCDLFTGSWVKDDRGPIYTNTTCKTLPDMRNCARYGKDQRYVYWRWKPNDCELPVFDPHIFLKLVRGKKLMFIGDSLARNQMESLLCLLSQAEIPTDTYKDPKDKHRTWYFPSHNFTLMVVWTEFFVDGHEIMINGTASNTFTINLDRMNPLWANKLPELKYAILNGGNWFSRKTYVHQGGKLIGCVHCKGENGVPSISVHDGLRMVFRAAFKYISECGECGEVVAMLRTYSMAHFENGQWFTGGYCNRSEPLSESELGIVSSDAWEFRRIQMEEMERVRAMTKMELLDVTRAMMFRADAHPGRHWLYKVTSDCLHWCLPGPIDTWNELLLEVIKKHA